MNIEVKKNERPKAFASAFRKFFPLVVGLYLLSYGCKEKNIGEKRGFMTKVIQKVEAKQSEVQLKNKIRKFLDREPDKRYVEEKFYTGVSKEKVDQLLQQLEKKR